MQASTIKDLKIQQVLNIVNPVNFSTSELESLTTKLREIDLLPIADIKVTTNPLKLVQELVRKDTTFVNFITVQGDVSVDNCLNFDIYQIQIVFILDRMYLNDSYQHGVPTIYIYTPGELS